MTKLMTCGMLCWQTFAVVCFVLYGLHTQQMLVLSRSLELSALLVVALSFAVAWYVTYRRLQPPARARSKTKLARPVVETTAGGERTGANRNR
jgi:hypothetical protein